MAKVKGGVRNVSRTSKAYQNRLREVEKMRASGKYSSVKMPRNGTGWVAIEKSTTRHYSHEIEAAYYMAKAGYKVILKDEAGSLTTPDGFLFSYVYEQKTLQTKNKLGIYNAIHHAYIKVRKGAHVDVAVIYDQYGNYGKKDIDFGLQYFESRQQHRFHGIVFISKSGKVSVYRHNQK